MLAVVADFQTVLVVRLVGTLTLTIVKRVVALPVGLMARVPRNKTTVVAEFRWG